MTLLRIIIVFILIYLVFRVITLYIMPWLLKKFIERQRKKYYERTGQKDNSYNTKNKSERDINISNNGKKQLSTDDVGEYVDFKEIKDDDTSKNKD